MPKLLPICLGRRLPCRDRWHAHNHAILGPCLFFQQSVSDLKLKSGNLSETEKKELIRLLAYLEKFHTNIYFNDSGLSFEEMIEKHLL